MHICYGCQLSDFVGVSMSLTLLLSIWTFFPLLELPCLDSMSELLPFLIVSCFAILDCYFFGSRLFSEGELRWGGLRGQNRRWEAGRS